MHRSTSSTPARLLRAALAAAALFAAVALPAQAQDPGAGAPVTPTITVVPSGGSAVKTRPFSDFERSFDVHGASVRLPDGSYVTVDGITLRTLFAQLRIASDTYNTITAIKEDGSEMDVRSTQVLQAAGDQVIVFVDSQGVLRLLRPQTSADGRPPELATAADGVLRLALQTDARLVATPPSVRVNQIVQLTLTLPSGLDPASVEYLWDFNVDGKAPVRNRQSTMSFSYKSYGDYNPNVTILVGGAPYGDLPATAAVSVSAAPRIRDRRNRTARNAGNRRVERPEAGDGQNTDGSGSGTGGGSGGGTGAGYGGSSGTPYTPPATPPPVTPPAVRRTPPARRRPTPPAAAGETVDGYLLASADGAPLTAGGEQRRSPAALVSADDDDGPLNIPAVVWVLCGLAGLVMLGWALESRTTLPYFKP